MDYAIPHQRKTKRDKKAKRKHRVYKRGGKFRTIKLKPQEEKSKK